MLLNTAAVEAAVRANFPQLILGWLETHAAVKPEQIAIYGVSGGRYFTAPAAEGADAQCHLNNLRLAYLPAWYNVDTPAERSAPHWK